MLRVLLTRFQYKAKLFTFPFNFEGLSVDEQILQTRYLPTNQRCRQSMAKIFEEDLGEGFKFAFKNVLGALESKDLDFLKEVCEPTLYGELEKSLNLLNGRNLHVKSDYANADDLSLKYTSFSFVYGVAHDRRANKKKENYEASNLWNLKNGINLQFYKPTFEAKPTSPFMRVGCLFSCPNAVYLKDKGGEVIGGQTSTTYHKMIFEGVSESTDSHSQVEKQIWKTMSNNDSEEKFQLIRNLFQIESMTWKVIDIDNYMNGNPYVA